MTTSGANKGPTMAKGMKGKKQAVATKAANNSAYDSDTLTEADLFVTSDSKAVDENPDTGRGPTAKERAKQNKPRRSGRENQSRT